MVYVISLLLVILMSSVVIRVGARALVMTGLSEDVAYFQSKSAFSATGYTTRESELLMEHPVRRQVLATLMTLGNAGTVSILATAILSGITISGSTSWVPLVALVAGLVGLALVLRGDGLDRAMRPFMEWLLSRYTALDVTDYVDLLGVDDGRRVAELRVEASTWWSGRPLSELELTQEGVQILLVRRTDGTREHVPTGTTTLMPGDYVVAYGDGAVMRRLTARPTGELGDAEHHAAVSGDAG